MWIYDQSSGKLSHNGEPVATGYAGHAWGKNNPNADAAPGIGPIPRGLWRLVSVANSKNTGPFTITLEPAPGTDTHGRSQFRCHGDSIAHPGEASHGCIILPRPIRERIWASNDRTLEVVG